MSNADEPKCDRPALGWWDAEHWSRRPLVNADVAAYQAGRLLNVFAFHAQQAWLLSFRCLDDRAAQQHEAASGALRTLQSILPALRPRNLVTVTDLVTAKLRCWHDAALDYEYVWELNDEVEVGSKTREECCRDLLFGVDEVSTTGLRQTIERAIEGTKGVLLRLGECVDAGARPKDVYRYLWDSTSRPYLSAGETLQTDANGRVSIHFSGTDDGEPLGGIRGVNSFANRGRNSGELPPDSGWLLELRALLRRAELDAGVGEVASPLFDGSHEIAAWVDGLDEQIRSLLAPTVPYWTGKVLRVGKIIVKDQIGKVPCNQAVLFDAFQRAGWTKSIKNPFRREQIGMREQPDEGKLKQTVTDCNRRQRTPLLKFSVGESGASVSWEFLTIGVEPSIKPAP